MRDAQTAVERRDVTVRSGEIELAGSWWEPAQAIATVLMHPGSGPSDRENDQYFPPIRDQLLTAGIAVASFDKRGVGGSTGGWRDAGIAEQAGDAAAALSHLAAGGAATPLGLFGHSQGGWVVLEAARHSAHAAFVITNSGPGVSPAVQDRFALERAARRAGRDPAAAEVLLRGYDIIAELLRRGASLGTARAEMDALGLTGDALDPLARLGGDLPLWEAARRVLDHDPQPSMRAIRIPLLAIFGAADEIVPVAASVAAYLTCVDPTLLTIAVLAGGDHRLHHGHPPALVDGYIDTLTRFIAAAG